MGRSVRTPGECEHGDGEPGALRDRQRATSKRQTMVRARRAFDCSLVALCPAIMAAHPTMRMSALSDRRSRPPSRSSSTWLVEASNGVRPATARTASVSPSGDHPSGKSIPSPFVARFVVSPAWSIASASLPPSSFNEEMVERAVGAPGGVELAARGACAGRTRLEAGRRDSLGRRAGSEVEGHGDDGRRRAAVGHGIRKPRAVGRELPVARDLVAQVRDVRFTRAVGANAVEVGPVVVQRRKVRASIRQGRRRPGTPPRIATTSASSRPVAPEEQQFEGPRPAVRGDVLAHDDRLAVGGPDRRYQEVDVVRERCDVAADVKNGGVRRDIGRGPRLIRRQRGVRDRPGRRARARETRRTPVRDRSSRSPCARPTRRPDRWRRWCRSCRRIR